MIFKKISPKQVEDFRGGMMVADHHLGEMSCFSDAALARLIETHPDSLSMVYAMPMDSGREAGFREGDLRNANGAEVLEAIRRGQLWVQLLRLDKVNPEFIALEKQILAELKANIPELKILGCRLSLLISSPRIHVAYHADIPRNALWQIRGSKKVYIYPAEAPFISEHALEGVYLGETQEAIPYDPSFDAAAKVIELQAGQMVTWPVNGPHRIVNDDELSVSLAMEYFEPEVLRRYAVYFSNGVLRRRFNRTPRSTATHGAVFWAKAAASAGFKLLRVNRRFSRQRYLTFRIDPKAPNGFIDTPHSVRDY